MIIDLLYGRNGLPVRLPDSCDVTVIRKPKMPIIDDPDAAVHRALTEPVNAAPLAAIASESSGRRSACILICDVTRPVPNSLFLRPMIETILGAGIPADRIDVVVATGLHRPNEGDELNALIGDSWVLDTVRVQNHFARNDGDHVDLGSTSTRNTPVKLNRIFVEADLKIATGLVEPHFMAGFSGGRKVVAPGVAHEDTIRTFHNARFIEDRSSVQCNLTGNPLHEEQMEIIHMLGDVYALNTVVDEARNLSFINFGEIGASHLAAVRFLEAFCTVTLGRRFKTVVTSAAGHPLDQTYYQTVKGMVMPMDILETPATLIVASSCSEGLGSEAFRASQRRLIANGPERFLQEIMTKQFAEIDEWQSEMQLRSQRIANVQLFTDGLDIEDRALTGVNLIDSVEDAVKASVAATGDPAVAIIPEGPYVVPVYAR